MPGPVPFFKLFLSFHRLMGLYHFMVYYMDLDENESSNFDLSQIFIEREQQQMFFKSYLFSWREEIFNAEPDEKLTTSAPSPFNKIPGLFVLLYGHGGFGKSTLLRYLRNLVLEENQNSLLSKIVISEIIDWEFALESKRGM